MKETLIVSREAWPWYLKRLLPHLSLPLPPREELHGQPSFKTSCKQDWQGKIHTKVQYTSVTFMTSEMVLHFFFSSTVELHLSRLIETTSHPDMQKIQIIVFFFENMLHWKSEVGGKNSTNGSFGLHINLCTNKTLIHNFLCVFDNWGKNLGHKKM